MAPADRSPTPEEPSPCATTAIPTPCRRGFLDCWSASIWALSSSCRFMGRSGLSGQAVPTPLAGGPLLVRGRSVPWVLLVVCCVLRWWFWCCFYVFVVWFCCCFYVCLFIVFIVFVVVFCVLFLWFVVGLLFVFCVCVLFAAWSLLVGVVRRWPAGCCAGMAQWRCGGPDLPACRIRLGSRVVCVDRADANRS